MFRLVKNRVKQVFWLLKIFEIISSKLSAHDFIHYYCTVYIFIVLCTFSLTWKNYYLLLHATFFVFYYILNIIHFLHFDNWKLKTLNWYVDGKLKPGLIHDAELRGLLYFKFSVRSKPPAFSSWTRNRKLEWNIYSIVILYKFIWHFWLSLLWVQARSPRKLVFLSCKNQIWTPR